jgi:hypothetical protein
MWSFKFLVTKTYKQLNNGIFLWKGLLSHLPAVCIFRLCIPWELQTTAIYILHIQSVVRKPPLLTMYQCFLELVTCCLWCYSKCIEHTGQAWKICLATVGQLWIYTQSNITNIIFTWVHSTNTEKKSYGYMYYNIFIS